MHYIRKGFLFFISCGIEVQKEQNVEQIKNAHMGVTAV